MNARATLWATTAIVGTLFVLLSVTIWSTIAGAVFLVWGLLSLVALARTEKLGSRS